MNAAPIVRLAEPEPSPRRFDEKQRKLILDTCCGGATEEQAETLIAIAEARGLNPIAGECYFVKRWTRDRGETWAVQASIDSFRIKAEETGLYAGQDEPEYEKDAKGLLLLARVRVYRKDWQRPVVGVARWSEYVQLGKDGKPTRFWHQMPYNQLAKCAEALALRKAFPKVLSKVYTPEEMAQSDNPEPTTLDEQVRPKVLQPSFAVNLDAQCEKLRARLAECARGGTLEELEALGHEISAARLPPEYRNVLATAYQSARAEIRARSARPSFDGDSQQYDIPEGVE